MMAPSAMIARIVVRETALALIGLGRPPHPARLPLGMRPHMHKVLTTIQQIGQMRLMGRPKIMGFKPVPERDR